MWQEIGTSIIKLLGVLSAILTIVGALLWPSVPGWLAVALMAGAFAGGFFFGRGRQERKIVAIKRIVLYQSDAMLHGWTATHDEKSKQPSAQYDLMQDDNEIGRYMSIDATPGTRVEYEFDEPALHIADEFELVYSPEAQSNFYLRIAVSDAVETRERHWIQYKVGNGNPKPVERQHEWLIPVQPSPMSGKWLRLRRNIKKDFALTFGQEDLHFERVTGLRIRGKMSIASITLYAPKM